MSKARDFILAGPGSGTGSGPSEGVTNKSLSITADVSVVLDLTLADTFIISLTETYCAISFSPYIQPANTTKEIKIIIKQTTGANRFSFGTSVAWVNDAHPVSSFQANTADTITLLLLNGAPKPLGYFDGGWINV